MNYRQIFVALAIALLLISVSPQNSTQINQQQRPTIQLATTYTYDLPLNEPYTWSLKLPETIPQDTDLFITVQSPPNEPLQQPYLTVKSAETSIQQCNTANNEFVDVCIVDKSHLSASLTLSITALCMSACHLRLTASLEPRLTLELNRTLIVKSPLTSARQYEFQVQVPLDQQFTQLAIYAQISDFSVAGGGLELLANIGGKDRAIPTPDKYDQAGQTIFWGGLGLYFSKREFTADSNWIKIYLSVAAGMEVKLYSKLTNGNDFIIQLQQAYFDYTTDKQPKNYYLDLKKNEEKVKGKTVLLGFIVYAGAPIFQVCFDFECQSVMQGTEAYGTISYLITSTVRDEALNFTGTVYIKVSSTWNADYYFYTALHQNGYFTVSPDIAYYNELKKDQVFNYFMYDLLYLNTSDPNASTKRNYAIKINLLRGKGIYGVRRCRQVEQGQDQTACVVNSTSELMKDQSTLDEFKSLPVTIKTTENYYQILFEYDLSSCHPLGSQDPTIKVYYCSFHALGANKESQHLDYTWMISQRMYSSLLKEGQLTRDAIFQGQFLYYRFGLSSIAQVEEVAFFVTVVEGDTYLLGSTSEPYPSYDSKEGVKSSGNNRIGFSKKQLANNMYIAVYGLQYSQYTIGVVVKRSKNDNEDNATNTTTPSQKSAVKLQLGLQQEYVLKKSDAQALFSISSFEDSTIKIQVFELVGSVQLQVKKSSGEGVKCLQKSSTSMSIDCTLKVIKGDTFDITVTGTQGTEQRFVIAYYKAQNCVPYSLNLPLYKQIPIGSSECVSFSVTKVAGLKLSNSISIQQMLQNDLSVSLCINNNCFNHTERHFQISKELLSTLCDLKSNNRKSCPIKLTLTNNGTTPLHFYLILEEESLDVALFDGVSQKVQTEDISTTKGKQFYYQVHSDRTIRIFFTSFTSDFYCILAHFVSQEEFVANSSNVYLDYGSSDKASEDNKDNNYRFYKSGSGSNLLAITADDVKKYCKNCVLTLAVYSVFSANKGFAVFEVQVSQQQTVISIGQSKIGYLEKSDFYVYQLQQPTTSDGIISVRDLNRQSSTQSNCFQISLEDVGQFSQEEVIVIDKLSTKLNLYVSGIQPICEFEISYTSLSQPIKTAILSQSYSFVLNPISTTYFLYNHHYTQSFRAVNILSTGTATIGVMPIDKSHSLKDILKVDPLKFPITTDESSGQLLVMNTSAAFCSQCTYVIAVSSKKGAKGELFLSSLKSKIPLSIKGTIRQTIKVNQISYRNYTSSSLSEFNITINMIYGRITVTVIDPNNKTINSQTITESTVIKVPRASGSDLDNYEYESIFNTYSINVEATANSSFTIQSSKISITKRLLEGVISYVILNKDKPILLQFLNLYSQDNSKNSMSTLNVLIEVIPKMQENTSLPKISVTAATSQSGSPKPISIVSRKDSDNSINVELSLMKGDYYLNITSDQDTFLNVLLVKESLVHLKPDSNVLMTKPGTFELYSPQKSVMLEIFACYGDLQIEATDDYKDFDSNAKSSREIALEQSNYGGHFVVSQEFVYGEYFLRINSKAKSSNIAYTLNYFYYNKDDVLPYRLIDLRSPEITYSLGPNSITYSIEPILVKKLNDSPVMSYKVEYRFYISSNRTIISKFANCRLDSPIIKGPTVQDEQVVNLTLESHQLVPFGDIFFVGAEAIVSLRVKSAKSEHYPSQLNLIYDSVQISNPQSPKIEPQSNYSAKTILVWMLLPFLIAGVALYLAIRFCIKKYRGMLPDDLVEEAGQSGEVANPDGKASNSNASGTFKYDAD